MKMKDNPFENKIQKQHQDIYQNHELKRKKRMSQKKNSALIRSCRGFWEETSSLFCYLCLGQC